MTKLYDQWYSEGVYKLIIGRNMRHSFIKNNWMGTWHLVSTLQNRVENITERYKIALWFELCNWSYGGLLCPLFKKGKALQS